MTALILTAVFAVALTGCVNNDDSGGNGGDTPPGPTTQDVTLSVDQVKDYIGKIKIDLEDNPKMTYFDGYSESTAAYSVTNGVAAFSTSYTYNGAEVTEYIGPWASAYRTVTIVDYGSYIEASYQDLLKHEYLDMKGEAEENMSVINFYIAEFKTMYNDFKTLYPDLAYENYSGTEYADGHIYLEWKFSSLAGDSAMDMTATLSTDTSKRITEFSVVSEIAEGFASDAFDSADISNLAVRVEYGEVVNIPNNGTNGNTTGDVTIYTAYGDFPTDFTTTYEAGSTVTLPSAPINTGLSDSAFLGWYYDRKYEYPVENNAFEIGYSSSFVNVYPKFSLTQPQLVLNGGSLPDEDNENIKNIVTLSEYNNIVPSKDGYVFDGWYFDAEFTDKLDWSNTSFVEGKKLYAKFIKKVKVDFVTNADYDIVPQRVAPGNNITLPIVYKKGYSFDGWYKDAALTEPFDEAYAPDSDLTLYAKFKEGITVNLVYYDNFNNSSRTPKYFVVSKNGSLAELTGTLNEIGRIVDQDGQGKLFTRWAIDKNGTAISSYPTSEVTYYAYFTTPAKLTTKVAGGTYESEYYDTLQRAYLNNGANYTFEEWLNMQEFENTLLYNSGMDINQYKPDFWYIDEACTQKADLSVWPTVNTTLYMKIVPREKITFNYDGSTVSTFIFDTDYPDANSVYEYLNYYGLLPGNSWALGIDSSYMLEGWYTDVALTQKYEISRVDGDFPDESISLYAKVTENYNFIVNANVESITTDGDLRMGNDAFPGLGGSGYTKSLLKSDIYYDMITNDITFAEYMTQKEGMCLRTTVLHDVNTSKNYIFTGFYTDAECTSRYTPGEEMDSAVTIYFGWEEQQAA